MIIRQMWWDAILAAKRLNPCEPGPKLTVGLKAGGPEWSSPRRMRCTSGEGGHQPDLKGLSAENGKLLCVCLLR